MESIRIVLADDHGLMRQGTRQILEQCPDLNVVGEAEDGRQALQVIEQLRPDVAIVDVRMPGLNGIELVQRMKELSPETAALILTAYDDDEYILALMEAGALGYLLKTARGAELMDTVRRVHRGETVLHPAIARKVAQLWMRQGTTSTGSRPERLRPRELSVLKLAAKGLRNKAIAEQLNISVRTVEGHFRSILAKLGVSSRVGAILYGLSHNLITLEADTTQADGQH
jgi:DNA-binding NarL/FixJ family response regulator